MTAGEIRLRDQVLRAKGKVAEAVKILQATYADRSLPENSKQWDELHELLVLLKKVK